MVLIQKCLLFVIFGLYVLTAWNSHGYYHADEHYQILEFSSYWIGTVDKDDLPWEFDAQIRPALQPITIGMFRKALAAVDIQNPYEVGFALRMLSQGIFLGLGVWLCHVYRRRATKFTTLTICFLVFCFWFLPFLSARVSSETWSGLAFLASCIWLKIKFGKVPSHWATFGVGGLMGLSFILRFQMAFAVFGYLFWLIKLKAPWEIWRAWGFGFGSVCLIGFFIDSYFYEQWTCTAWNYFYHNIILNKASSFGVEPWYFYVQNLLDWPSLILGLPVFFVLVWMLWAGCHNVVNFAVVTCVLAHSLVAHKEIRFLFPLVFLWPIWVLDVCEFLRTRSTRFAMNSNLRALGVLLLVINSLAMFCLAIKPAGIGRMGITKYIHDHYQDKPIYLLHTPFANPYDPWGGLPAHFYAEKELVALPYETAKAAFEAASYYSCNGSVLVAVRRADMRVTDPNVYGAKLLKQSLPKRLEKINRWCKGFDNEHIIDLYEIPPSNQFDRMAPKL